MHRGMQKQARRILNQSFAWIRAHPDATNRDVPEKFLDQWVFHDDDDEPKPAGFFLSVFTFGYLQHQLLHGDRPPTEPRSVPVTELIDRFSQWQLKLALTEIHRRTSLQIEPLSLFGFSNDEIVMFGPKCSDAAGAQSNDSTSKPS
jgi:hypothetical protein